MVDFASERERVPIETDRFSSGLSGTVLCIEDRESSMAFVEAMVASLGGVAFLKAFNGREGIELARTQRPDVVLLDMHLPDIGGLEVVRALNPEISRRQLRVILLTADSLSMDIIKAMSLGAHEYWIKPVDLGTLEAGLRRALRLSSASAARTQPRGV